MPSSSDVRGGGLRLQFFATLAIAVVTAAIAAAVVAYHVFDRELERGLEARLEMLVAETVRVLDAGIAAGLELDRPQLQERALRHLRVNLSAEETIAVVDATGRIVASSNSAEIGELVPHDFFLEPAAAPPAPSGERIVAAWPIQSLFGAPAGHVIARAGPGALDQPRQAFVAKVSLTTAGAMAAGLVVAALAAARLPWRARRVTHGIARHTASLYAAIGTNAPPPPLLPGLPPQMADALDRFSRTVESREHELGTLAAAVDALDEAA